MGLAGMFVGFRCMLRGRSGVAFPMVFGGGPMGFRRSVVMFGRFLVSFFRHVLLRVADSLPQ